jgi:hypothetical protein
MLPGGGSMIAQNTLGVLPCQLIDASEIPDIFPVEFEEIRSPYQFLLSHIALPPIRREQHLKSLGARFPDDCTQKIERPLSDCRRCGRPLQKIIDCFPAAHPLRAWIRGRKLVRGRHPRWQAQIMISRTLTIKG